MTHLWHSDIVMLVCVGVHDTLVTQWHTDAGLCRCSQWLSLYVRQSRSLHQAHRTGFFGTQKHQKVTSERHLWKTSVSYIGPKELLMMFHCVTTWMCESLCGCLTRTLHFALNVYKYVLPFCPLVLILLTALEWEALESPELTWCLPVSHTASHTAQGPVLVCYVDSPCLVHIATSSKLYYTALSLSLMHPFLFVHLYCVCF